MYNTEIHNLIVRLEALKSMWRKWIEYFKIQHIQNNVEEIKRIASTSMDGYLVRAAQNALGVFKKITIVSSEIQVLEEKQRSLTAIKHLPVMRHVMKPVEVDDVFDPSKSRPIKYNFYSVS